MSHHQYFTWHGKIIDNHGYGISATKIISNVSNRHLSLPEKWPPIIAEMLHRNLREYFFFFFCSNRENVSVVIGWRNSSKCQSKSSVSVIEIIGLLINDVCTAIDCIFENRHRERHHHTVMFATLVYRLMSAASGIDVSGWNRYFINVYIGMWRETSSWRHRKEKRSGIEKMAWKYFRSSASKLTKCYRKWKKNVSGRQHIIIGGILNVRREKCFIGTSIQCLRLP